jgi:uncharacterized protein (DUF1800 family)
MSTESATAIAANRFGLGARPGELERMGSASGWLKTQLRGDAPLLQDTTLQGSREVLIGAAALADERRAMDQQDKDALKLQSTDSTDAQAAVRARLTLLAMKLPRYYRPIYVAEARARMQQAVLSDRPFVERLVQFWSNHFAVSVDKIAVLGLAGCMEREAIRPHVLGNFSDMLLAVEKHPAMLLFLDNVQSVGPNSPAAQRLARRDGAAGEGVGQGLRQLGLNENLAREILELHTLGVGNYTQADVTSFAKVITGWSAGALRGRFGRLDNATPGEFTFREMVHEPGAQMVVSRRYSQNGIAQGEAVLRDLAAAPATATHLATKLARHFIADDPPASAVQRLSSAYLKSGGHLPTVYEALIDSPEAWAAATPKYKTPQDYIFSLYRGLELPLPEGQKALAAFEVLGQRQFSPGSPAGWPDRSADWDGSAALLKRIELADSVAQRIGNSRSAVTLASQLLGGVLSEPTRVSLTRAESGVQALTLLLTAPEFLRR